MTALRSRRCLLPALIGLAALGSLGCESGGVVGPPVDASAASVDMRAPIPLNPSDGGAPVIGDDDDQPQDPVDPKDQPLVGLSPEALALFDKGDKLFEKSFAVTEGLGPLYIRASCAACHVQGGSGPGSVEK